MRAQFTESIFEEANPGRVGETRPHLRNALLPKLM